MPISQKAIYKGLRHFESFIIKFSLLFINNVFLNKIGLSRCTQYENLIKRFFNCSDWVLVKVPKVQTHRSTHRVFGWLIRGSIEGELESCQIINMGLLDL